MSDNKENAVLNPVTRDTLSDAGSMLQAVQVVFTHQLDLMPDQAQGFALIIDEVLAKIEEPAI